MFGPPPFNSLHLKSPLRAMSPRPPGGPSEREKSLKGTSPAPRARCCCYCCWRWREAALYRCLHRRRSSRREAAPYRCLHRRRREAALIRCLHRRPTPRCSAEMSVAAAAVVLGEGRPRNCSAKCLLSMTDRPVSQYLDFLTPLHGEQRRGYRRCCSPLPLPQRLLGRCCYPSRCSRQRQRRMQRCV